MYTQINHRHTMNVDIDLGGDAVFVEEFLAQLLRKRRKSRCTEKERRVEGGEERSALASRYAQGRAMAT